MAKQDKLNAIKGRYIAGMLDIEPEKDGYYHTGFGRKTACGFYLAVKAILRDASKIRVPKER